jgi:hypothetical protein
VFRWQNGEIGEMMSLAQSGRSKGEERLFASNNIYTVMSYTEKSRSLALEKK